MKKLVTVNPRKKIKEMRMRFFDRELDFRVRLFNVLAIAGTAISLAATVVNLITSMWVSAAVSGLLAVLSFALTYFTYKTGKYQTGYIITIIAIFMVFFPMLFFTSGGYKGGTPALFIFAVLFTTLMLEGKWAILVSFAEIAEYVIIAVIAYKDPTLVTWFATEWEMLADIIFTTIAVCIACGTVIFFHLREYEAQRIKLSEQNEQLKHYSEAKSVFLTTVAHEIKNPLNAINLYAHDTVELLDEKDPDINTMRANQNTIEKMVLRIDRIVVELMDTVAIEQGRLSLDLAPVRLSHLLRETTEIYFNKNNTGENRLILKLDEKLPPIVADSARIIQVVTNLLSNSMQHTKNGFIMITLKGNSKSQIVSVTDNGEGMSEEIKSKVFGGYISVNKEKWRHGIGLFVSRQIIEAHEGKVWIESELGKGTTVSFSLPYGEKTDE